jgi:hypothetical protein
MVGIVADQTRPSRLVLSVDVLAKGASLDIDAELLEPADRPAVELNPARRMAAAGQWNPENPARSAERRPPRILGYAPFSA